MMGEEERLLKKMKGGNNHGVVTPSTTISWGQTRTKSGPDWNQT